MNIKNRLKKLESSTSCTKFCSCAVPPAIVRRVHVMNESQVTKPLPVNCAVCGGLIERAQPVVIIPAKLTPEEWKARNV